MELLSDHFNQKLVFVKVEIIINQLPELMLRSYYVLWGIRNSF